MAIQSIKQLCTPSALINSDSLVEQVAQIEDFSEGKIDGREFFRRNHFTEGLSLLVARGFERLAGRSEDGAFYLTQAMGGGKTHGLIAFGLLAQDPGLRREVIPHIASGNEFGKTKVVIFNGIKTQTIFSGAILPTHLVKATLWHPFGAQGLGHREWMNG